MPLSTPFRSNSAGGQRPLTTPMQQRTRRVPESNNTSSTVNTHANRTVVDANRSIVEAKQSVVDGSRSVVDASKADSSASRSADQQPLHSKENVSSQPAPESKLSQDKEEIGRLRAAVSAWARQNAELRRLVDELEYERNFYFGKLRQIELLIDDQLPIASESLKAILLKLQEILYKRD